MKKIALFAAAFVCFSIVSHAQITKGSLFLGGSFGFSNSENEVKPSVPGAQVTKNENNGWNLRPQIGFAVANNRVFGAFFNVGKSISESTNSGVTTKNEGSTIGGGVFYRSYFPLSQRFYLFGDAGLGVNVNKTENTSNNGTISYKSYESKSTGVNATIAPGIAYAASRKLFLEASMNNLFAIAYSKGEGKSYDFRGNLQDTNKGNSFSADFNANGFSGLAIGLRWILPRK